MYRLKQDEYQISVINVRRIPAKRIGIQQNVTQ